MTATAVAEGPRLSEIAKVLILPEDTDTTEWPSIRDSAGDMGIVFDRWQADAISASLCKNHKGVYSASVGGIGWSFPRQVGKTFTLGGMLFALAREIPGLLVLWTSHHTRTTAETFGSMKLMAARPLVKPYIDTVRSANGQEAIIFKNGSRILFGARDQGFGLGFAAVDVIVFDEAQRLNERTRVDMIPAANRPTNPAGSLIFYIGTPPRPTDRGEAFTDMRDSARNGKATDTLWVELGAPDDADPDDQNAWRKANPSFPVHTPLESMLRMRKHLGDDESWKREALGIWDPLVAKGVIPAPSWEAQGDPGSVAAGEVSLGVEVGPDLAWASISLAGRRPGGEGWHIELDDDQHTRGRGVEWLVPSLRRLVDANPQIRGITVDVGGPIAALLNERKRPNQDSVWTFKDDPGLEVTPVKVQELGQGCSTLLSGIITGFIWHIDQPQMNAAALSARKRMLADSGLWVWHRASAESDITQIQSATLALIGAQKEKPRKPGRSSAPDSKNTKPRRATIL